MNKGPYNQGRIQGGPGGQDPPPPPPPLLFGGPPNFIKCVCVKMLRFSTLTPPPPPFRNPVSAPDNLSISVSKSNSLIKSARSYMSYLPDIGESHLGTNRRVL